MSSNPSITFPSPQISMVTGFTYRDGMTFLGVINEVSKTVNDIVNTVNEISASTVQFRADVLKAINESVVRNEESIRAVRTELINLITETTESGSAIDPTTGEISSVTRAISNAYDYARVHALFASQLDARDLTAAMLDATGGSARHEDTELVSDLNGTNN